MHWPGKRRMTVFARLQAFAATSKMLVAALLCRAIDLKLVYLVHLTPAVTSVGVGKPGAIPPRMAASKRVGVNGLLAWCVALLVVVSTDASGAVALASPGIEKAPTAVSPYVITPLRRVGRRSLGRLTAWLRRRHS